MTKKKKALVTTTDDNFVWVGDPDTGRWVTIDEYNRALNYVSRGSFESVDAYFRFLSNYDDCQNKQMYGRFDVV